MLDSRIQSRYLHHEELIGRKNNPVKTLDYIQGSNVTGRRLDQKIKEASRDEILGNGKAIGDAIGEDQSNQQGTVDEAQGWHDH